jgi:Domain of unknown function (DUF4160)
LWLQAGGGLFFLKRGVALQPRGFGADGPRCRRYVAMPTIKNIPGPYRFFFYSFDCAEPMHVHAQRENRVCKFWLEPVELAKNQGFSARELNQIRHMVESNLEAVREAWHEHCD